MAIQQCYPVFPIFIFDIPISFSFPFLDDSFKFCFMYIDFGVIFKLGKYSRFPPFLVCFRMRIFMGVVYNAIDFGDGIWLKGLMLNFDF